jgi:hypothetical protein
MSMALQPLKTRWLLRTLPSATSKLIFPGNKWFVACRLSAWDGS